MKVFLKELKFESKIHSYLKDITLEVNKALVKSQVKSGLVLVNSKHTTLGVLVNEIAEPNLLEDIVLHTKTHVHEDIRSTWITESDDAGYQHATTDYKHRCMDSPLRDADEIDEDYNAGRHIRAILYSHQSLAVPIRDGKLELGKYQQVAAFEFDGRDGSGKNPMRNRTIQIWIYPMEDIEIL
jgi:secondary thiamine-phosphate synthase enzyme